jgi:xanthine/CO dehydrogenase XdhC/CoxF family maturation factor
MTTRALLSAWSSLVANGEAHVIATVVDVRGSAYRRPGARMLVSRDRWVAGSVSGGCLEGDIVHKGFWRAEAGPVVVTYDATHDPDGETDDELRAGLGLGCNGVVDVLLERAGASAIDPLAVLDACVTQQRCAAVATVFRSSGPIPVGARLAVTDGGVIGSLGDEAWTAQIAADSRAALRARTTTVATYGELRVLIEVFVPPPRLHVIGAGHDAVPVVEAARAIGWQVFVCLPHARPAAHERFAHADGFVFGTPADIVRSVDASDRAAVVVMNHNYERDRAALAALASSRATYLGVLGPRHRTLRMLAELARPELERDPRLHAPVGLALGAETPEEIAVAIVAEIQSVLTRTTADRLRDRPGTIHAVPPIAARPSP